MGQRSAICLPLAALWLCAAADPGTLAALVGRPASDLIEPEDTVLDVAHRHRLGFDRVARANPEVEVWIPEPGTVVVLPTLHVLPDAPPRGLVINVPEMQLYDFTVPGPEPEVFAIAIGDQMDPSLIGSYKVGRKRERPVWTVPASIRAEKPELPAQLPPGPDNPLGDHWMTIGRTTYGIHGTNNPWSIGREATHGCIRLYNDEIARLFARTREGTPITLVYQTVKLGQRDGLLYVEAHPDVYGRDPEAAGNAVLRLQALGLADFVDERRLLRAIAEARGIPVPVGAVATSRPPS